MKQLLLAVLLISAVSWSNSNSAIHSKAFQNKVYICNSNTAYAYHNVKDCSGLNRCNHQIIAVSEYDAKNTYGRRKCKVCY